MLVRISIEPNKLRIVIKRSSVELIEVRARQKTIGFNEHLVVKLKMIILHTIWVLLYPVFNNRDFIDKIGGIDDSAISIYSMPFGKL